MDLKVIANQALRFGVYTPKLVSLHNKPSQDTQVRQGTVYLRWLKTLTLLERRDYGLSLKLAADNYNGKDVSKKGFADAISSLIFAAEFEGMRPLTNADLPKLIITALDLMHQVFTVSRELVLIVPENSLVLRYSRDWKATNRCIDRARYGSLTSIARRIVS